jgi:hypothetical protein
MGGQTALNCALDLHKHGVLAKYGVEMIGANEHAIEKAEDRLKFKDAMTKIGLGSAKSGIAHSMEEAWAVQRPTSAARASRWSSAPASRWAAPAAASPTTRGVRGDLQARPGGLARPTSC